MTWYLMRRDGLSTKLNLLCGDYMGDWLKKRCYIILARCQIEKLLYCQVLINCGGLKRLCV
jgi:hypothetical protein